MTISYSNISIFLINAINLSTLLSNSIPWGMSDQYRWLPGTTSISTLSDNHLHSPFPISSRSLEFESSFPVGEK